jgi:small-conductance mechanosensitive channel
MAADQLGVNVGAALAGLGVAGIAVGFAAQDSIANVISGIMIFWDKPFVVGDWITVEGEYGKVSDITLRTTRIRTPQNTWVVIPNKRIIDAVLDNHSKQGELRLDLAVGIAYKEHIPAARKVILEAVTGIETVLASPPPDVVVESLGNSSVNLLVRVWIENADDERRTQFAVIEASKLALDAAGIQIPYPHLQLFVDEIKPPVWKDAARLLGAGAGGALPEPEGGAPEGGPSGS